jgi:anti-sigma factor RsiW
MNTELKMQALLDGELDAREAREVQALLANDAQHAALMQELTWTKAAVAGGDVAVALPETREFYWSKISRGIEAEERKAAAAAPAGRAWWLKFFYPATGLAAMVAVMFVISGGRTSDGADTESVPEDVNAVSFRSETEKMSVVYVADENGNLSPVWQELKNEPEADK